MNQESFDLYQKARAHADTSTREGFNQAVLYFNQSLHADPNNSHAYTRLSHLYRQHSGWYLPPKHAMEEAKRNALRAVALNDTLMGAHQALGYVKLWYDWDWPGASNALWRSREFGGPNDPYGHIGCASYLGTVGRQEEALAEARLALAKATNSIDVNFNVGFAFLASGEFEQAVQCGRTALARDTNGLNAHFLLGRTRLGMRHYEESLAEFGKISAIEDSPDLMAYRGFISAVTGRRDDALKLLEELANLSRKGGFVARIWPATIHSGLGETNKALACLQQAYEERSIIWDDYRTVPEFIALFQKVGLEK